MQAGLSRAHRIVRNPYEVPALLPAIRAAKDAGCLIRHAVIRGADDVAELHFEKPDGAAASVALRPKDWPQGGARVRAALGLGDA